MDGASSSPPHIEKHICIYIRNNPYPSPKSVYLPLTHLQVPTCDDDEGNEKAAPVPSRIFHISSHMGHGATAAAAAAEAKAKQWERIG